MAEEYEETQTGYEDGMAGGPGAPTPLSGLEVSTEMVVGFTPHTDCLAGCQRTHEARHSAIRRRRIQHG